MLRIIIIHRYLDEYNITIIIFLITDNLLYLIMQGDSQRGR